MTKLTEYISYADAQQHFSSEKLWDLFDGDRERLNIAHECVDRYMDSHATALIVVRSDGPDEIISYKELSEKSSQFAHYLQEQQVKPGDRVAVMLEPSLAFYVCVYGIMKMGPYSLYLAPMA
jgi:acetyl-CoA synthetase